MATQDSYKASTDYDVPVELSLCDTVSLWDEKYTPLPEAQWFYPHPDPNSPRALAQRWVYVISLNDSERALLAEYFCDAQGQLSVMPGAERSAIERTGKAPTPTNSSELRLPTTVNGIGQMYSFFVSRVRLTSAAIRTILAYRHPSSSVISAWLFEFWLPSPPFILWNESGDPANYQNGNCVPFQKSYGHKGFLIRAVDPFAVVERLSREYIAACDAVISYAVIHAGANNPDQIKGRHQKLLLARALKSILESPNIGALNILDNFSDGTGEVVKAYVDQWGDEILRRIAARERCGTKLVLFLESDFFKLAADTYSADHAEEAKDYNLLLDLVGTAVNRLSECLNGRTLLGKWVRDNPYWLKTYVLPQDSLSDEAFQAARKSAEGLMHIWEECMKAEIATNPTKVDSIFATFETKVTYVVRDKLFTKTGHIETYRYVTGSTEVVQPVTVTHVAVIAQADLEAKLNKWIAGTTQVGSVVILGAHRLFEVVNLASSAGGILKYDTLNDFINLGGDMLDATSAFSSLLGLSKLTKEGIGALSSVIDVYLAGAGAKDAYSRNDYSSVAGNFLIGLGSTAMFLGALEALGAKEAVCFGWKATTWGAIATAMGWTVVAIFKDSPLEQLVSHCCFGDNYGDGTDHPKWTRKALAEWRGNRKANGDWDENERFDVQLESLLNLVAAFRAEPRHSFDLRITPAYLRPESKFLIAADVYGEGLKTTTISRHFELAVNVGTRTMAQTSGDPADLNTVSFYEDQEKNLTSFEIVFTPLSGTVPALSFLAGYAICFIRLDLHGDGSLFVPVDPFVLRIDLRQTTTITSMEC